MAFDIIRRNALPWLLVSVLAFSACASGTSRESSGEYVDDTVITAKVKAAVFNDANLKFAEINVETFKGRVQLSGFVGSQADIQRAMVIADQVPGMKSIVNDMKLK